MPVHAIVFQRADIRLIVANGEIFLAPKTIDQGLCQAAIAVPQNAKLPGAPYPAPDGRETVDLNEDRRLSTRLYLGDAFFDFRVIGLMVALDARSNLLSRDISVFRNNPPVREPHDDGRIVMAPIEIHNETGPWPQYRGGLETLGEGGGQWACADIICGMGLECVRGQSERFQLWRYCVRRVIAKKEEICRRNAHYPNTRA